MSNHFFLKFLQKTSKLQRVEIILDQVYQLVALKGSTSQRFVELNIPNAHLTLIDDYDEGVELVVSDQADAMVADFSICAVSVLRYPEKDLTTLNQPLTIEPIGIALPPDDPQLVNLVQNRGDFIQKALIIRIHLRGNLSGWN